MWLRQIMGQLATVPLVLAGASLLAGWGGGLYWLAASAIFALVAGMIGAWVLLIEILR
jgi:modulator of FtsH protease